MRYLTTFSYDGSNYSGYQIQPNKKTIEEEFEKVLKKIFQSEIKIYASGRTDAKVHALNQSAHFDLNKDIEINKLIKAINSLLPNDIYVNSIIKVNDDFHARYNAKKKEYIYKINIGEYNPIEKDYVFQYNKPLNIKKMKKALKYFKGKHDFKAFSKVREFDENFIRTIYKANLERKENIIIISFVGDGFLRYMVRNMVGLLIEIGSEKKAIKEVNRVLESKDRKESGIIASPEGLYLKRVFY